MDRKMTRYRRPALAVAATLLCMSRTVWADEAAARQHLRDTYTFSPHELTTQQIGDKSKVLDEVWARAKGDTTSYLPALRSELARVDAQGFFVYPG